MDHTESTYDVIEGRDWHAYWPHLTATAQELVASRETAPAGR
jgi:hypothetical protein